MSQIAGNIISAVIVYAGVFTVKPSSMPLIVWLLFFVGLVIVAGLVNYVIDTKFGNKIKHGHNKWTGKHSKNQYQNRSHSVQ